MKWLLVFVVLLSGLAAVGTSTVAGAATLVAAQTALVSQPDTCVEAGHLQAGHDFKPCGKLRNGLAIPCDPLPAIIPASGTCLGSVVGVTHDDAFVLRQPMRLIEAHYRPPRGLPSA